MDTNSFYESPVGPADWFNSDEVFDRLFSPQLRQLSNRHWTTLGVAAIAASFLARGSGNRILDIGSGVGKFCLVGAYIAPDAFFCGVERRKALVSAAREAQRQLRIKNVEFLHADCTELRFRQYNHFYFHSPFHENLIDDEPIDDEFLLSLERFQYYSRFVFRELLNMPPGTRLCTYNSLENEIPPNFRLTGKAISGLLRFWEKE